MYQLTRVQQGWSTVFVGLFLTFGFNTNTHGNTRPEDRVDANRLNKSTASAMCLFHHQHSSLLIEYQRQNIPKHFAINHAIERSPELAAWRKLPFHPQRYIKKKRNLKVLLTRYANYVYRKENNGKSSQEMEPALLRICTRFYTKDTPRRSHY
jgi:hypothetical protein